MSDQFVAEIRIFPFGFAPTGWALCDGQLLPISQNTALFSLLGTTYGGNGQTDFALPDLRGRDIIGAGQGPGLDNYVLGETIGNENVTLTTAQMGPHDHTVVPAPEPASIALTLLGASFVLLRARPNCRA